MTAPLRRFRDRERADSRSPNAAWRAICGTSAWDRPTADRWPVPVTVPVMGNDLFPTEHLLGRSVRRRIVLIEASTCDAARPRCASQSGELV